VKALKEMKVNVAINTEGNVLLIVPAKKATGKLAETKVMIARLYTLDEIDKETAEAMQQGCHTYERVNRRIRQKR
jgi:predicted nucleotide-binding protein (sugar kinase/HSP70/actin superfamily)